ncbi:MAG TPA: polymer-forming cytoskeletal protein [Terriglobales bacterium]|jgi:cytoskeletal protein CcmA (bactofilin family)|nr:polymer-forming cytoskeletal protein [Terriglobales bacterium]
METSGPSGGAHAAVAHIGKSVVIKGELSGSEDLYLDGEVEGKIDLREHHLTIGPHARVRAGVNARDIVVQGQLNGNVHGRERVELKKSAVLTGDIVTQRIVIEDGAVFKGSIETQREAPKAEPKREAVETVATSGAAGGFTERPAVSGATPEALVEQKK